MQLAPVTPPSSDKAAADPFDLDALRLSGTADGQVGTRKVLVTVPVRKPDKAWFIRVHPDQQAYGLDTLVLDLKEDGEMYLVAPPLRAALAGEPLLKPYRLVTATNRQGACFLWPFRLPGPDGKQDSWMESALTAADRARTEWVRVTANTSLGAYDLREAADKSPEPAFAAESLKELLQIAFKGKYIDSLDHPVLKQLRGEV